MTTRSEEFVNMIENHPSYQQYRKELEKERRQRTATETKAQYERFLRVADNVILAENLKRMGNEDRIREYESIIAAEGAPLFGKPSDQAADLPTCP